MITEVCGIYVVNNYMFALPTIFLIFVSRVNLLQFATLQLYIGTYSNLRACPETHITYLV